MFGRLSGFVGSLRASAFSGGDPDGSARGRGGRRRRGVGALLRDHIGFAAFSAGSPLGRNVEAALRPRPRLRQRVFDSLDSLLWIRGKVPPAKLRNNRHPRITAPTPVAPGYTERPARVQFMLGRVGLCSDHINTHNRRPARLQFMVGQVVYHCAAASGSGHCPLSDRWRRSWRERGPRDRSRRSPSRLCWASRNRQPSPTGRDNTSRTTRGRADSPS